MILSKKNFKLYFVDYDNSGEKHYIPFSSYHNQVSSKFATFNEQLTEKVNSQFNLSFSLAMTVGGERNFYLDYLVIDREIRLEFSKDHVIDFIIIDKQPSFGSNSLFYSFTCQDSFSFLLSKQKNSISISTEAMGGPQDIVSLIKDVLSKSSLSQE
jgi:hypothetical protein